MSSSDAYERTLNHLHVLLAKEPASQPLRLAITAAIGQLEAILAEIRKAIDRCDSEVPAAEPIKVAPNHMESHSHAGLGRP